MHRLKHQTQCNDSFIQPANHYHEKGDVVFKDGSTIKDAWKEHLTPEVVVPPTEPEPEVVKAAPKKKATKKDKEVAE